MAEDEVRKIDETRATTQSGSTATTAGPAPPTSGAASARASGERTGELDPGKSTQKGDTDYFDGKSVITDADTVVDIATIMKEHGSNMKPEKMAEYLKQKGYDVEVVKMGNRSAVKFRNGDYFVDSDGDGNIGTKDQNFQNALSAVEQKFGINLSELKASKNLQIHKGGGGRDAAGAGLGIPGLDALGAQKGDMQRVFAQLDTQMAERGYEGTEGAEDLWKARRLSPVLQQLDIPEPPLPEPGISQGLDLFQAAYAVAKQREAAMDL